MRWWSRPSRPLLAVLALVFAASLLVYTALWFVVTSPEPKVQLGFDDTYLPSEHAQLISAVYQNSPAEKAGLLPGDRIVAIDGQPVADASFRPRIWMLHQPGDRIRLTIARPGTRLPVFLTAIFRQNPSASPGGFLDRQLSNWFPAPFVLVGLAVLFLRLQDPNAWLLVLVFAGLIATRNLPPASPQPPWWPFAMAYQALLLAMLGRRSAPATAGTAEGQRRKGTEFRFRNSRRRRLPPPPDNLVRRKNTSPPWSGPRPPIHNGVCQ